MQKKCPPIERARCPCFMARTDYKGSSYIHCNGSNYRYPDSSARESQYRTRCCGNYEQCELYQGYGGNDHDHAGDR